MSEQKTVPLTAHHANLSSVAFPRKATHVLAELNARITSFGGDQKPLRRKITRLI